MRWRFDWDFIESFWRGAILTILILLVHEHEMSFHFLVSFYPFLQRFKVFRGFSPPWIDLLLTFFNRGKGMTMSSLYFCWQHIKYMIFLHVDSVSCHTAEIVYHF